jgi:hypothetical protein
MLIFEVIKQRLSIANKQELNGSIHGILFPSNCLQHQCTLDCCLEYYGKISGKDILLKPVILFMPTHALDTSLIIISNQMLAHHGLMLVLSVTILATQTDLTHKTFFLYAK